MKKQKVLVVANWKMNPETPEEAKAIYAAVSRRAKLLKRTSLVVCPSALHFALLRKPNGGKVFLGVQNLFWEKSGAFVGEISPAMVAASGAAYAIVGHSERRAMGETDEMVGKKTTAALRASVSPVFCIGEKEHDSGGAYFEFLKNQIHVGLRGVSPKQIGQVVIAYEPLWAIGKAFTDAMKPSDVHETTLFIRKILSDMFGASQAETVKILYGGSVDFENALPIIRDGKVDGLLVGRQSLEPDNFNKLLTLVDGA